MPADQQLVGPARLDQVQKAWDGGMVIIDQDVGGVAEELRRLDPGLKVRVAQRGDCFAVFYQHCAAHQQHQRDCADCTNDDIQPSGATARDLVLTRKAWKNSFGTLEGLGMDVVEECRLISSSSYDFAREVERQNKAAEKAKHDRIQAATAENAEQLAHAIRRDMGWRYKGRATPHRYRKPPYVK